MSEWISSREALRLAKERGVEKIDLIEWARLGSLGVRAKSRVCGNDDPHVRGDPPQERLSPEMPPTDEIERSVHGPWPDIPKEFWEQAPKKAAWGAGTFTVTITEWEEYYQDYYDESIELRGVTFNKGELEALLSTSAVSAAKPKPPEKMWQKKRVTPQQALAIKFIDLMTKRSPKDLGGKSDRHRIYCAWHEKQIEPQKGKALGRTTLNECASRYEDGWRVVGARWVHDP